MKHCTTILFLAFAAVPAPARVGDEADRSFRSEVRAYLDAYGATYQRLQTEWQDARWDALRAEDPRTTRARRLETEKSLTDFTGSIENIELSRAYLRRGKELSSALQRELARVAHLAAGAPQIVPDLIEQRRADEVDARDLLATFPYSLEGRRVTSHDLERVLRIESDLARRRAAYDALGEAGVAARPMWVRLRWLRNESVRSLGQSDYFSYRVAEFGLTPADVLRESGEILHDLRPLQTELHTWMRYELARRYGRPVPDAIPAHWLPDPFGVDASSLVDVAGFGLVDDVATEPPRAIVGRADAFYTSLGFKPLSNSAWNLSKLEAFAPGAGGVEELDPTTWHVDLDRDVRLNLSLEPGWRGYVSSLRALGLAHGALTAANSDVPVVSRTGSGRLFRRGIADLLAFAGSRPNCLAAAGIGGAPNRVDPMQRLLSEALDTLSYVSFASGTALQFEKELYRDDLSPDRWNARWWQLVERYQGITAPAPRDERWCDPAGKSLLLLEPGEYAERGLARVLSFQLHDHVARKMLDQDPHEACYANRRDVGDFLRSILRFGGTVDWRVKLREKVGADLSARALLDYFEPLHAWLVEQNRGRRATLPPM